MCGILFVYRWLQQQQQSVQERQATVKQISSILKHRGPDENDTCHFATTVQQQTYDIFLSHERLSIIDLKTGRQPLFNEDHQIAGIHNGEIWNHDHLHKTKLQNHTFHSHSDSESIIHMYEEFGAEDAVKQLDGYFAFVVYDSKTDTVFAGRDPIGIKPMFIGKSKNGSIWFSSEVKALVKVPEIDSVEIFPPGFYYLHKNAHTPGSEPIVKQYYNPSWLDGKTMNTEDVDLNELRGKFEHAVQKKLMSDVPIGVFLSGGLDSSLVAATMRKLMGKDAQIHSFSVGVIDAETKQVLSPDVLAARQVAEHLGTTHHEKLYTVAEGLEAIKKVIYHIESYDVTSIRASTPMFFLSELTAKYVKVVLSGEGSDEIFAGYKYFHDAESVEQLQAELVRKVRDLFYADVLRADRATAAHGLEVRVPFLDLEFLDLAMMINARQKLQNYQPSQGVPKAVMEKYILRDAFDDGTNFLPKDLLWRVKEQFSDGVGKSWISTLRQIAEDSVSDEEFAKAAELFPHNTPSTKEAFRYRVIYESYFPSKHGCDKLIKKWLPWCKFDVDPSGYLQRSYAEQKQ